MWIVQQSETDMFISQRKVIPTSLPSKINFKELSSTMSSNWFKQHDCNNAMAPAHAAESPQINLQRIRATRHGQKLRV